MLAKSVSKTNQVIETKSKADKTTLLFKLIASFQRPLATISFCDESHK